MLKDAAQPIQFLGGPFMNSRRSAAKSIRRFTILLVGLFAIAFVGIRFAPQMFVVHANGESGTRLLRMPTVSATQIAFAYAQNIWAVPKQAEWPGA
jgi:hypothetical protein